MAFVKKQGHSYKTRSPCCKSSFSHARLVCLCAEGVCTNICVDTFYLTHLPPLPCVPLSALPQESSELTPGQAQVRGTGADDGLCD